MSYATPRKRKYTAATRAKNKARNIARHERRMDAHKRKLERRARKHPAKFVAAS